MDESRRRPAVLFFDVGGTLLRFNIEPSALFSKILAGRGEKVPPPTLYHVMREVEAQNPVPLGPTVDSEAGYWRAFDDKILRGVGITPTEELLDEIANRFRDELRLDAYPETVEVLSAIRGSGQPMGVISNASHGILGDLRRNGLSPFFELIVYSQAVGASKPDARIFRTALEAFGVSPKDAWHVGDNLVADIAGARALGVWPVFVNRRNEPIPDGASVVDDLRGLLPLLGTR